MASLEEFARERSRPRRYAWWWKLPESVRDQLVESETSTEVCVLWLRDIGYEDASFGKVDPFRRKARRERQADAD